MGFIRPDDKIIPDCTCKYCGYVAKGFQFIDVFECIDYETKRRKRHVYCPKCKVMDTI